MTLTDVTAWSSVPHAYAYACPSVMCMLSSRSAALCSGLLAPALLVLCCASLTMSPCPVRCAVVRVRCGAVWALWPDCASCESGPECLSPEGGTSLWAKEKPRQRETENFMG